MKRRKSQQKNSAVAKVKKPAPGSLEDDGFFMGSDSSGDEKAPESEVSEDEFEDETADEKRIRLAKAYLKKLELDKENLTSDEDVEDDDVVTYKLQQDVLRERGQYQQRVADKLREACDLSEVACQTFRGHRLAPTCLALNKSNTKAYTGAKDATLIQWDIESGKRIFVSKGARGQAKSVPGHTEQILALALSDDDKFLATGGNDNLIKIWDPRTHACVHSFKGHRDSVTSLVFRKGTQQLFSGSADRTIKVWNLEQMAYVESLFGHQADVQALDSLFRDRTLSVSQDKTVRNWKVVEETQLMFKGGHDYSIDTVSMINEERWFTGGQDGILALWGMNKKKPLQLVPNAHSGKWISSVAALPFTDVLASGSSDGFVRVWKCNVEDSERKESGVGKDKPDQLSRVGAVSVPGYVNALKFASDASFIVAATGNEHRLGRWEPDKAGKNGIAVIPLAQNLLAKRPKKAPQFSAHEEDDNDGV